MKISACYIVCNEAQNLPASLLSLCNLVDEIILVDTGSTDNTKEIARSFGCRIYDFPWQDDFAAPRNFALTKAQGEWIIFIDADEYFPEACRHKIRPFLAQQAAAGFTGVLLLRRYDIDSDNHDEILANTLVGRIFYHDPRFCYVGRIHEELLMDGKPITELFFVPEDEIRLIHTGYRAGLAKDKASRNLDLLLRELKSPVPPDNIYMYLADAYLGLDNYDMAKHYALLDVAQGRRQTTYASRSYRILLQLSLANRDSLQDRLELCEAAVGDFPESPEFRADLATCLAAMKNYQRACVEMRLALQAYENYRGIEPMLLTPADVVTAKKNLAQWQAKLPAVTMADIALNLQLLLRTLCKMSAAEYAANTTYALLPEGFQIVLGAYHRQLPYCRHLDDGVAKEYLDIMDVMLYL